MDKLPERTLLPDVLFRYQRALCHLESIGVSILGDSRLRAYEATLQSVVESGYESLVLKERHRLAFCLREIDEISGIADSFPTRPPSTEFAKLRLLACGTIHSDDSEKDPVRDVQYELFLRGVFERLNLQPRMLEPDLELTLASTVVSIAAKRPRTAKTLFDRLEHALGQVSELSSPSFVALSLDLVVRPRWSLLKVPTRADASKGLLYVLSQFLNAHGRRIVEMAAKTSVLAVILTMRLPVFTDEGPESVLATHLQTIQMIEEPDPRGHLVGALTKALQRA